MKSELNFTKAALAALPVPAAGKRVYYRDSKTRGLMFAITDKGTRSYIFYRKIDGRPERILLGRFDDLSIEQVRNRAAEMNALIATGKNPADKRRAEKAEMTLGDLFGEYMERHAKINVKYAYQYQSQFRMYFCSNGSKSTNLAGHKLSKIKRTSIAEVHSKITRNNQPLTANRVLGMISSVFSWATRAGLLEHNPAQGIRKNSERDHARDRFLKSDELPYFFQSLAAHANDVMRDYVLLSLLTGQRQANVLAMEWGEVDFAHALWRIPKTKTKTKREYVVPLTSEALQILTERHKMAPAFGNYVLPGPGSTGHLAEPKKGWKRILHRAELFGVIDAIANVEGWTDEHRTETGKTAEFNLFKTLVKYRVKAKVLNIDPDKFKLHDLRMHDLRRTLASWQAMTGANLVAISKTLNHSNVATTSIYARLQVDPVRQAIQVATGAMFAAGGLTVGAEVVKLRAKG